MVPDGARAPGERNHSRNAGRVEYIRQVGETMKPSVAFAVGLWTGGLIVGAVWSVHYRWAHQLDEADLPASPVAAAMAADVTEDQNRQLEEINAYLAAENERLAEAITQFREDAALDHRRSARRHRRLGETARDEHAPLEEAVELRDLTKLALQNDPTALEAIAQAAESGQAALLRVWRSGKLTETNYLAMTGHVTGLLNRLAREWDRSEAEAAFPSNLELEEANPTAEPAPEAEAGGETEQPAPQPSPELAAPPSVLAQ